MKARLKTITRRCSECDRIFSQEIIDMGKKRLTTEDHDEYCPECNKKAMR